MENKVNTRIEKDSMGELHVPEDALYGAQTQRAVDNFPVSGKAMPMGFIQALIQVKKAAAQANLELATLEQPVGDAICSACDQLLADPALMRHFPVDIFQTGSGTSTNMNANEVIARLATQLTGTEVHPNDHVNYWQSINDIIPTTIHVSAAIAVKESLLPAASHLYTVINQKAQAVGDYCKTGRTHLMDAMPVRMDQSLSGWQAQIAQQIKSLSALQPAIQTLALGGTAVGTGVN
ncbi:MAG: lyase family protein, partial [Pseudomonadota bacterium]|nr:lyase family protein [Pseudomonadota bacterium]